jgi:hypothetical protein
MSHIQGLYRWYHLLRLYLCGLRERDDDKTATTTQLIDSGINLRLTMIIFYIFYDQ